jgi:Flp pilus assembly protein TadD
MRRTVWVLVLAALAGACSSSSHPAAPNLTQPCPALGGHQDLAAAKRQCGGLVKEDPRNKLGWYNLGVIAEATHDTNTASTDYAKAIEIDPRFEPALYNYGLLRYNAGDSHAAISYLRRAVAQNPKDANALWHLGLALQEPRTKATDLEATHFLNAALKLDPSLIKTLKPQSGSGGSGARSG